MGNTFALEVTPINASRDNRTRGAQKTDPELERLLIDEANAAEGELCCKYPGTVEELHKNARDVMPLTMDGAKIMINKGLSNNFQVTHTLTLGDVPQSGYRFGVTYVGTKEFGPDDAFPVLVGEMDPHGNMNATIIHQLTNRLRCKFASQIRDSVMTAAQLSTTYRGDSFSAGFVVENPNIFNNSGVYSGSYLQSLTKKFALGVDMTYQYGPNVPGGHICVLSGIGRYKNGDSLWSGTVSPSGMHFSYFQKCSDQLQMAVDLVTNLQLKESVATLGYQVHLLDGNLIFRGSVNTNWVVCGMIEKRLAPIPFTFALSGCLNHADPKGTSMTLGCGLVFG